MILLSAMEASPDEPKPLTLCKLFSETSRVTKSNRGTFLSLAFLFLFPSSIAAVLPSILSKSIISSAAAETPAKLIIVIAAAAYLAGLVFTPCAFGSITYTAFHGFHGEPVKLKAAVKSIAPTFFLLLATVLAIQLIVFAATIAFALLVYVITTRGPLGLTAYPQYVLGFATALFVVLIVRLQVDWTLAHAVVVAESRRGFEALKRSKELIEGKRGLALWLCLIYGGFSSLILWETDRFYSLVTAVLYSSAMILIAMVQLYGLVSYAVLYVYCRADTTPGGGDYYFVLPVDDEKVALVV